ncbi:hypothetical protein [Aliiglaciecola litoralis]|uniref:hypothetical protein n=1 Tax=Aliiglaciecola litoralis TaxID=582857 RepID=UPI0031E2D4AC
MLKLYGFSLVIFTFLGLFWFFTGFLAESHLFAFVVTSTMASCASMLLYQKFATVKKSQ